LGLGRGNGRFTLRRGLRSDNRYNVLFAADADAFALEVKTHTTAATRRCGSGVAAMALKESSLPHPIPAALRAKLLLDLLPRLRLELLFAIVGSTDASFHAGNPTLNALATSR
jgi:hypothetical protein